MQVEQKSKNIMVRVVFKYRDRYSKGEWREQTCVCDSVNQCIWWYGLGVDCDYYIVSVTEIKK